VPALVLRPSAGFDTDDLESVIDRWTSQAPAVLVIEDLNWLLESVNVSTFLNLLDGIESKVTGGLLLIATTNYPEKLDPAINNRPGRFDVVVELPPPNREARGEFLARKLPDIDPGVLEVIAAESEGVSFAHLQEILRLSGLLAIQSARGGRTTEDVRKAAEIVRSGFEDAQRGFPSKAETPFGLAQSRRRGR
jgi:SpoVK/Ycf46/Vps4 family AAA+-type ATPase